MPHLTVEYSANLRNFGGFSKLCNELAKVLVAQQVETYAAAAARSIVAATSYRPPMTDAAERDAFCARR